MQLLLVEDDLALSEGLQKALKTEGFTVNHVVEGLEALSAIRVEPPDAVILDIGLPDIDGLELLRRVRQFNKTLPVIILTARDSIQDKIIGLDCGADDYLAKPFDTTELFARLRVLERRLGSVHQNEIKLGLVSLDISGHTVQVSGKAVDMPRHEYQVLKALMENAGRILTRQQLESKLYSWDKEVASNALEVHIHNVRKKLPKDFIKTVRGVGYTVKKS
ncbi:Two-component system response regulator QseB [hydrothermal vent metagenome]|uniref:Two-component system response regulator QseB n=1 Tax=hydrothermal vent metagenome TaxID=652676 RepID=A0A3B0Z608_9ZZZZ